MKHVGVPLEELGARILDLRQATASAGRHGDVPVTLFGADPDPHLLESLDEIGVRREPVARGIAGQYSPRGPLFGRIYDVNES
jgi:hypothetical protein